MILADDVKCLFCGKVFCCINCREKHENKEHQNEKETKKIQCNKLCSICNNRPLLLQKNFQKDLLQHIFEEHMPLHCKNCMKVYETWESLQQFSKCLTSCNLRSFKGISKELNPNLKNDSYSKDGKESRTTQTSPGLALNIHRAGQTPSCLLSFHLKVRNKFENGSSEDSLLSSIENCSDKLIERKLLKNSKGTLVRSTSTPMQALLSHTKDNVFDSSSYCHVSSIRGSSSESDHSPPPQLNTPASSSTSVCKEVVNENLKKIRRRVSAKMASPLRQIMSKSIQRALAKHNASEYQEDIIKLNSKQKINKNDADTPYSPLDLRTTPALRRTQSEDLSHCSSCNNALMFKKDNNTKEMVCSSQKLTTQSITSITSSTNYEDKKLDTVYTTCRSVEVVTTTEINEIKLKERQRRAHDSIFTPKTIGGPFKKIICFDTPSVTHEETSTTDEVFYTPSATPLSISDSTSKESVSCNLTRSMSTSNIDCKDGKTGRLWSMVTSVIKLPSFRNDTEKCNENGNSVSLIRRCASFAEDLIHSSLPSEQGTLKRRRNGSDDKSGILAHMDAEAPPKRIRKIHGRRPIERMLKNK